MKFFLKGIFFIFLLLSKVAYGQENVDIDFENLYDKEDSKSCISPYSYASPKEDSKSCTTPPPCISPYSYVNPLRKGHVYAEGEWLYWKILAEIPFADVITVQRFPPTLTQEYPGDDKEIRNRYKFESGYRIKLGFQLPYQCWNFYGQYQKITASSSKNVDLPINTTSAGVQPDDNKILYPYWANTTMRRSSTLASYKWGAAFSSQNAKYRILDLAFNKTFYTCGNFAFTPTVGVRSGWIRNELNVAYTGVADTAGIPVLEVVKLQNNFYGWGIRFGAAANWILGCGFEFFGKTFLSTLYGDLIYRQNGDFTDIDFNNLLIQGSSHRETTWNKVLNSLEIAAGLNWGRRFCRDKMYFGINFSYEFNYWPNFIRLNRYGYASLPNVTLFENYSTPIFAMFQNDLTLHGITLGAKIEY